MPDEERFEAETVDALDGELRIRWGDGHASVWDLRGVRQACPCAHCNATRDRGLSVIAPDGIEVVDAKLVGSYGITFHWSDGHQTGIYQWLDLRAWCQCRDCGGQLGRRPNR